MHRERPLIQILEILVKESVGQAMIVQTINGRACWT